MALYDANPEWLQQHGLKARDALRLFRALCTLADYEGVIKRTLPKVDGDDRDHHNVCAALRYLVDGPS